MSDEITSQADPVPRDETHDSIDPVTGALTSEAVARRAELGLQPNVVGSLDSHEGPAREAAAERLGEVEHAEDPS